MGGGGPRMRPFPVRGLDSEESYTSLSALQRIPRRLRERRGRRRFDVPLDEVRQVRQLVLEEEQYAVCLGPGEICNLELAAEDCSHAIRIRGPESCPSRTLFDAVVDSFPRVQGGRADLAFQNKEIRAHPDRTHKA